MQKTYNQHSRDFGIGYIIGALETYIEESPHDGNDWETFMNKAKGLLEDWQVELDVSILAHIAGTFQEADTKVLEDRSMVIARVKTFGGHEFWALKVDEEGELVIMDCQDIQDEELRELIATAFVGGDKDESVFDMLAREANK